MGQVVLVTGAGGLLAGEVARRFAEAGADVHAFARSELDVTDERAVGDMIGGIKPTAVVHCAAMTNVDDCELDAQRANAVNATGSRHVAEAARAVGAEVVAVSTDYVFDGEKGAYTEDDPTNPIQSYGRSKLAGEDAVREAAPRHYIIRSAWIYGWGGKNFLSKLPEMAEPGGAIKAVVDQRGSPTYAGDLADAISWVVGSESYGTYHVINEGACSFAEFCRYGLERLGASTAVEEVTASDLNRPAPRPKDTSLVGAAWQQAGFETLRGWREAAKAFLG